MFAATVTTGLKAPAPIARSILKPDSLFDWSAHVIVTALLEVAVVPSPVGAAGGVGGGASVVALAVLL
jgi:hypothetical protein